PVIRALWWPSLAPRPVIRALWWPSLAPRPVIRALWWSARRSDWIGRTCG
ncbi:MAG: hypothetical protein K0Q93_1375, partial [Nocardioidaceae bacterium]|nr:hypothetical protein [Nocardioidaceae bacterium]